MHPYSIIALKKVNSTNAWAKKAHAQRALPVNTVIVAETQTKGRGQLLTKWHDEPGKNLLFTLFFEPKRLAASHFFCINSALSLALIDALGMANARVKWPNDIVVNGRKIAGILVETIMKGEAITHVFAGIGVNVNQTHFPAELKATSIALESGQEANLDERLHEVLIRLDQTLKSLTEPTLLTRYNERLYGLDEELLFEDKHGQFQARVAQVDQQGILHLRVKNGSETRTYRFKEVKWLSASE
jgi:BirA family biotin operon repressor/biotin-[acetyl-CoA-carboxylase] ligase